MSLFDEPCRVNYLTRLVGGVLVHSENYHGCAINIFMRADRDLVSPSNTSYDDFDDEQNYWRECETTDLDEALLVVKRRILDYYESRIMPIMLDTSAGGHPPDAIAHVRLIIQSIKQDLAQTADCRYEVKA